MRIIFGLVISCMVLFSACEDPVFSPKPRGFYRIDLPIRGYQTFSDPTFPYHFEYPVYGSITKEHHFFGEEAPSPYWLNVDFPNLGAKFYLSYNRIHGAKELEELLNDAHFMSYYHSRRADFIEDNEFHTNHNVHGIFFNVGGDAASAYQFIATDSNLHFLRGALYLSVSPNADSLKPVNEFLRKDMEHLIETLEWSKN